MDFDQILEEIGEFGRYQRINFVLICLPVLLAAGNGLVYVFTAGTPAYRCTIPQCDDPLNPVLFPTWLPNVTPGAVDSKGHFTPESCYRFRLNDSSALTNTHQQPEFCPKDWFNSDERERCFSWIFDPQERTIVQEWDLTCNENAWRLALVGTIHFGGLVLGTAVSGYLADLFGRKLIFITCTVLMGITGIAQGLAWDYNSFIIFTFLNAIAYAGVYPLAFIIGVEMVGPRMREMATNVLNYFYAVGEALVGLSAWLLHDWQQLQYALSAPALLFTVYFWIIPESVRWLLARKENEKACEIIKRVATANRKQLSADLLSQFNEDRTAYEKGNKFQYRVDSALEESKNKNELWIIVKDIFHSKSLILRYTMMIYIWVINAVVYYGLSLNSTNLSGNKYLNFSLVCLVEIPGYTLAWISLRKFGRRISLSGSLFLCAVTCLAGGYTSKSTTWAVIILFLVGKLGITSSFSVVYTYSAEMMPTLIRSGGVGVMSTFARFGAMVAPFVPLLGTYFEALPLLLFGTASASAGLLSLFLPETFRKPLPDTVEDAKNLGKKKTSIKRDVDPVNNTLSSTATRSATV